MIVYDMRDQFQRRGRLHKRLLADSTDPDAIDSKRQKNDSNANDDDQAGYGDEILHETDYYFENGL